MSKYQGSLLFCMVFGMWIGMLSQSNPHQPSRKAQKRYDLAVQSYMVKDIARALELVAEAIERDSEYFEAWMLQSQLLEKEQRWPAAAHAMNSAMALRPSVQEKWGETWSRRLFRSGDSDRALEVMEQTGWWSDSEGDDAVLALSIRFASYATQHPVELQVYPLRGDVNTESAEYYPTLFVSGQRMIFTRDVATVGIYSIQEDFFEAVLDDRTWRVTGPLIGVNTSGNEGAPAVRGDGRRLVFTACETAIGDYGRRSGSGSCDLFEATWNSTTNRYEGEINLESINTRAWESQPALSADGSQLFFVRGRQLQDGSREQDIWFSKRNESNDWSTPKKLLGLVNTPGREENPVLHPDGKTLYFASDGHPGMGGLDLFVSRKQQDGSWGLPENLGYPINTAADENSLQVFPDGRRALFATDRDQQGNLDLWELVLPEEVQAEETTQWTGRVFDVVDGTPILARVEILDAQGELLSSQMSDPGDGEFSLPLSLKQSVTLQAFHPDYAFFHAVFNPMTDSDEVASIPMTRLEIGTTLMLRDVRFETSSAVLDQVFQSELNQLVETMNHSAVRILIIGHTDNRGGDEANLKLSADRAATVANYLVSNGVEVDRMELSGMGELEPIDSNETEYGRLRNRRTEIVIID